MTQGVKKILKISSFALFFIIILGYAFYRSHDLIIGVKIKNVNIVDGSKMADSVLKVTGVAKNATNLTLDGRVISLDKEGNFDETIVLLEGYNTVSIKAEDKFGHTDEKDYQLIY